MRFLSASALLFFSSQAQLTPINHSLALSQQAWRESAQIIQKIKNHPFNQKLMNGSLERDKFAYYIEQDTHYLQVYSRVNAIIASRIAPKYTSAFLKTSDYSANDEQAFVHELLKYKLKLPQTGLIAPATHRYNQHLLKIAQHEPVAVAVAAILPCQWIYFDVGTYMAKHATANNPYAPWFKTYSSDSSKTTTERTIQIFDELARTETTKTKERMIEVFKESSQLELDFWDDAYHKVNIKATNNDKIPNTP